MDLPPTQISLPVTLAVLAGALLHAGWNTMLKSRPVAYTMWFFAANGAAIYLYGGLRRGAEVPRYLMANRKRMAVGAVCTTGSYAIALWAMTRAPVALVACLRETSVIFVAPIGAFFLGERFTRRRLFAPACVLAGLVALRF